MVSVNKEMQVHSKRIGVDLTPLLPGAANGGAKPLTLNLLRNMAELFPQNQYVLLVSDVSQAELQHYFSGIKNIEIHCVHHHPAGGGASPSAAAPLTRFDLRRLKDQVRALLKKYLPARVKNFLKRKYYELRQAPQNTGIVRQLQLDLLFYPFTAPYYNDPRVPSVSLVHDIQYFHYPQFFEPAEYAERDLAFRKACKLCQRIVTISEFGREAILEAEPISPDRVSVIYNGIDEKKAEPVSEAERQEILSDLGIEESNYLLYPANFWPHKNHAMLLVAFNIFIHRYPEYSVKLVLTGAPGKQADEVIAAAEKMGLKERVVFAGFVSDKAFQVLLDSASALIFPSLYEGFGMPVVEGMRASLPVLCSNVTSLPEVGGDAVLYFDPRKPEEIAEAIFKILSDADLRETLIKRGLERARSLGGPAEMARAYDAVFREVLDQEIVSYPMKVEGLYPDHWTAGSMTVFYADQDHAGQRHLEVCFMAQPWFKKKTVVQVNGPKNEPIQRVEIKPGQSVELSFPLPARSGCIEFVISPTFRPDLLSQSSDSRSLGLVCTQCRVVSGNDVHDFMEELI
ncbi:MAG: glycosyltransferase family 4 protein [Chloroflexi bacterium]|nr:glycosyltransferase family 4 protein [Chloroflexota bacterium]